MREFHDKDSNVDGHHSKYTLMGLAEHVGKSEQSGHYTAHTLRKGKWFKFDDEYFNQVSEKEALKREAYLLFYIR